MLPTKNKITFIWNKIIELFKKENQQNQIINALFDELKNLRVCELEKEELETRGSIIVHCHNDENKEINSVLYVENQPIYKEAIIYANSVKIGYGAYNLNTHNQEISLLSGNYTIAVEFNGMIKTQTITVASRSVQTLIFQFTRQEFDFISHIPSSQVTESNLSGNWEGLTPEIVDEKWENQLGWRIFTQFEEPYDGGWTYDDPPIYIKSSGSYSIWAYNNWINLNNTVISIKKATISNIVNYVPHRPYNTPYIAGTIQAVPHSEIVDYRLDLTSENFTSYYFQIKNIENYDIKIIIADEPDPFAEDVDIVSSNNLFQKFTCSLKYLLFKTQNCIATAHSPESKTQEIINSCSWENLLCSSVPFDFTGEAI